MTIQDFQNLVAAAWTAEAAEADAPATQANYRQLAQAARRNLNYAYDCAPSAQEWADKARAGGKADTAKAWQAVADEWQKKTGECNDRKR